MCVSFPFTYSMFSLSLNVTVCHEGRKVLKSKTMNVILKTLKTTKNNLFVCSSSKRCMCESVVFVCSQNRSACCVMATVWCCPPPGAGAGSGQLTGREEKGWENSQTLGSLGEEMEKG